MVQQVTGMVDAGRCQSILTAALWEESDNLPQLGAGGETADEVALRPIYLNDGFWIAGCNELHSQLGACPEVQMRDPCNARDKDLPYNNMSQIFRVSRNAIGFSRLRNHVFLGRAMDGVTRRNDRGGMVWRDLEDAVNLEGVTGDCSERRGESAKLIISA